MRHRPGREAPRGTRSEPPFDNPVVPASSASSTVAVSQGLRLAVTVALTLGLLIAAALWLRRRDFGVLAVRRPKPATEPPLAGRGHDLEIEAELQEMLAEENARRLHGMANAP